MPTASGSEAEDQVRLSAAYNNSIYLMLLMPYGALGFVGFLVYRQLKVRAALEPTQGSGTLSNENDSGRSIT